MILSTKKFNREIEALRQAAAGEAGLHPLRLAQLKAELLAQLDSVEQPREGRLLVEVRRVRTSFMFRYVLPTIAGVSVVGGTVLASGGALPGSTLYPVKRLKEQVALTLAVTAQGRAEVRAAQAEERLHELEQVSPVVAVEATTQVAPAAALTAPVSVDSTPAPRAQREPSHDEREEKVRSEAKAQVETALGSLAEVRANLKAKGKVAQASDVNRTIKRLKDEALRHQLEVSFTDDDEEAAELEQADVKEQPSEKKTKPADVNKPEDDDSDAEAASNTAPAGVAVFTSGIYGRVTMGPVCPVVKLDDDDERCADKPYQATLVVKAKGGDRVVAEVRSDSEGEFKLSLPPGEYLVVPLLSPSSLPLPSAQAQAVTVTPNAYTRVEITYDTGIR